MRLAAAVLAGLAAALVGSVRADVLVTTDALWYTNSTSGASTRALRFRDGGVVLAVSLGEAPAAPTLGARRRPQRPTTPSDPVTLYRAPQHYPTALPRPLPTPY